MNHPTLSIKRGDSVDSVRRALGLSAEPAPLPDTGEPAHFYHLADIDFWVFFDKHGQVYSIRFDGAYPFAVDGVRIGDTEEQVSKACGKPQRHFPVPDGKARWIYDKPRFLRVDFDRRTNRVEKIFREPMAS